jgi:hypothetical protein
MPVIFAAEFYCEEIAEIIGNANAKSDTYGFGGSAVALSVVEG